MNSKARLALVTLLLAATNAWANAFVDHAEPAVGSTVDTPPTEIKIWFTENVQPAFSQIQLLDRRRRLVTQNKAVVDSDDPALLKLSIPALKPGIYKVSWKVVSVDTHMTVGTFSFKVRKSKSNER
jgi:copper resistance protein C